MLAQLLALLCCAPPALAQDSVDDLLKEMRKKGDDTEITLLQKLVPADDRAFLRHCLATLAYRAAKATRDAPAAFAGLRIGPTSRTPVQILA